MMKQNSVFLAKVRDGLKVSKRLKELVDKQIRLEETVIPDLKKELQETAEYESLEDAKQTLKTVKGQIQDEVNNLTEHNEQLELEFPDQLRSIHIDSSLN